MREHIFIYNNDHLHDLFGFLLFNNLFNIIIVCSLPALGLVVSLNFFLQARSSTQKPHRRRRRTDKKSIAGHMV